MAERIIHNVQNMLDSVRGGRFQHEGEIVVIGLGRFGSALALELMRLGHPVLGIDSEETRVDQMKGELTQVAQADTTQERALRALGVHEAVTVAVCIGTGIEASVLTTASLVELEVPNIWAKAITAEHGTILSKVGAHHVVFPERQMGERVAHLVTGRLEEFVRLDSSDSSGFESDDEFVISQMLVPERFAGRTLGAAGIRAEYRVTGVCIKPEGGRFTYAEADTVLGGADHIVVAGHPDDVERFAGGT
ncbi:MAG: potassium channel family protein [Ilumatobacteraceae bacterium]